MMQPIRYSQVLLLRGFCAHLKRVPSVESVIVTCQSDLTAGSVLSLRLPSFGKTLSLCGIFGGSQKKVVLIWNFLLNLNV
jgi:hypothetical protein